MIKTCKENGEERGTPRSGRLTRQDFDQPAEAIRFHIEQRSFAHLPRCARLKRDTFPARSRLTDDQNLAAHCGKRIQTGP